jgi:predicted Zn-dependent protease
LYKYYTYHNLDFDVIKNDAVEALKDVTARYNAQAIKDIDKVDVLLKDEEVYNFFDDLISYFSYTSVYKQSTDKKIGDAIQKAPIKDLLTISYIPSSKADAFDRDGVLLKPTTIVEKGKLVNYFGNNQYAQYLNMVPTGVFKTIKAEKGKVSIDNLTKKPHLEIIALSGIQIDMYSGYIGGEVRLANYFDGSKFIPVSGFSFSGNIDACLDKLVLSKETIKMDKYQGPKYIKLSDMSIL